MIGLRGSLRGGGTGVPNQAVLSAARGTTRIRGSTTSASFARMRSLSSLYNFSFQIAECIEPVAAVVGIVIAERAFRITQVRPILHGLELMSFVPLVERIDVHEEESALRVRQRRGCLQPDRRL